MPGTCDPRPRCNLVLIMGSPRSGTTWLAKMFDSHRTVIYRHEPDSVLVDRELPFVPEVEEVPRHIRRAREYLDELKQVRALKTAGSLPMFTKSYRHRTLEYVRRGVVMLTGVLQPPLARIRNLPRLTIPDFVSRDGEASCCYVIKSVNSLGRTYLFSQAEPTARIVHILRHPCAFVASSLRGARLHLMSPNSYINTQYRMSQARRRNLTKQRLSEMSLEEQLSSLWMLQNEKVMEEMHGNPNYRVLVYEDLCRHPLEQAKSVFEFAGLDWDAQTAEFLLKSENYTGKEERYFQVIRNPLVAAYKWESELTSDQKSRICSIVRESLPGRLYCPEG